MKFKIYCLVNCGKPLSNKILDVLFLNAQDMIENKNKTQQIQGRDYRGFIKTEFNSIVFVGISGVEFDAELYSENGDTNKVKYIVRDRDLEGYEKAEWCNMSFRTLPIAPQEYINKMNGELN